jgi:sugar/nucleoside kinase (ribokinase family)
MVENNREINSKEYEVVLLGHFAKDCEIVNGIEKEVIGSAVYYGAFPLKAIGVNVAIVTKLAKKDFPLLAVFKDVGIPVFAYEAPETTGIINIYSLDDPDNRQSYFMKFAGPFREEEFPNLHTKVIHIASLMQKEVPITMIKKLSEIALLSIDAQGFMRIKLEEGTRLVLEDWKEKEEIIPHLKYLKADIAEATVLTGTSDLYQAAIILAKMGAKEILLTHQEGVLLYVNDEFYQAPFSPKFLRGRSGRGDTCISTYIGKRLTLEPYPSLCFAAALTTLKLEHEGPFRGDIKEVEVLAKKFEQKEKILI